MPDNTPMMRQYREIKAKNPDCLLFFRLGDFYEMFGDDAITASRELDLTLTTRDRSVENPDDRVPMCGVPYHSSDAYIARLVARGYKVAVCEQLQDPRDAKGLVERDIIRVVTPGTVTEPSMLDDGRANYLAAVYADDDGAAICYADISTGEMAVVSIDGGSTQRLKNELAVISPREAILGGRAARDGALLEFLTSQLNCFSTSEEARFWEGYTTGTLTERFGADGMREYGLKAGSPDAVAVGALLGYVADTRRATAQHLRFSKPGSGYMELDWSAIRGLELLASNATGEKRGSLLWVLDHTKTAMGRRLLRAWVTRPLLSPPAILRRSEAVSDLVRDTVARGELAQSLKSVGDLERLNGRIIYGSATARDLLALAGSAAEFEDIIARLNGFRAAALRGIAGFDKLIDVREDILRAIADDPNPNIRDGGVIRTGFNSELDRLRGLVNDGGGAMAELEKRERDRTGIKLKIGYNRVFGYYIEMPRSKGESIPEGYERRQTLANAERFVTGELKQLEAELLSAKDSAIALEYDLFRTLLTLIAERSERIQKTAAALAELDVYVSLAECAARNNYVRPEVNLDSVIDIRAGRHPVVEIAHNDTLFVPNDTYLDDRDNVAAVITGPNMAGKSTFMRQTALIVLLAQIGSFVPAQSAVIGVADRIFTRIGASDDLAAGKSTFMVEMTEASEILSAATPRSLLIFDEIGRGTSTYDGVAIARAILEYCATRLRAKTLFSTHYHELTEAEREVQGVKCYSISAKKRGGDLIFLRKISPGGASDSYGIDVANLAGLPRSVISRAREVMDGLQSGGPAPARASAEPETQISLQDNRTDEIAETLRTTDIDTITPLEAMGLLYELKKKVAE
ncbi:MAG: DNA mismatch repair protein MutS [Oscillospiraceae bacterium]|jgi:DNA mismatch repair protein MutS|nr:DNA mismatch repair protein MutS [Oscillospiraceae bacterium]